MQQLRTHAFLKERDGAADRSRRAAEFAASGRQTAFVEGRDEDPHRIDTVHGASRRAKVRWSRLVRWSEAFGHAWVWSTRAGKCVGCPRRGRRARKAVGSDTGCF